MRIITGLDARAASATLQRPVGTSPGTFGTAVCGRTCCGMGRTGGACPSEEAGWWTERNSSNQQQLHAVARGFRYHG